MVSRKVKFKMSVKELSFEFEGDQQVAQQIQNRINNTIASLANAQTAATVAPTPLLDAIDSNESNDKVLKNVTPRKPRTTSGGRTQLVTLVSEGFFNSERRPIGDIVKELERKGHSFKQSDISPVLTSFTKDKVLVREKNESGKWVYLKGTATMAGA